MNLITNNLRSLRGSNLYGLKRLALKIISNFAAIAMRKLDKVSYNLVTKH